MKELIENILKDGKIDPEEVQQLREALYEDGKIDKEEAEALFRLNNEASEKCPEFKELFVEALTDYFLENGELDVEEQQFLKDQIFADSEVDENEKALLEALASEVSLPEDLAVLID